MDYKYSPLPSSHHLPPPPCPSKPPTPPPPTVPLPSRRHALCVYFATTSACVSRFGHSEWVTCVAHVGPSGGIVSGGMDSKLCLWERCVCVSTASHTAHTSHPRCVSCDAVCRCLRRGRAHSKPAVVCLRTCEWPKEVDSCCLC